MWNHKTKKKSQMVFEDYEDAFKRQEFQNRDFSNHKKDCPIQWLRMIWNNSAFSYIYRNIKGDLNDCFEEAGKWFWTNL